MIAVDTNIIVRFLVRDDEKQAELARRRLKQAEAGRERLLIPLLVVLETIWVLESAYDKTRAEILDAIRALRLMPVFEFQASDVVERLLADGAAYRANLADILIAHSARVFGCQGILCDLHNILQCDQPHDTATRVHQRQLLDAVIMQYFFGILQRNFRRSGDNITLHHFADRFGVILFEQEITRCDNAH